MFIENWRWCMAVICVATAMLAACSTKPNPDDAILRRETETLNTLEPDQLCRGYQQSKTKLFIAGRSFIYGGKEVDIRPADREILFRQELKRRKAIRTEYWKDIDAGSVRVGMNQTELLCAADVGITSTSITNGITRTQWQSGTLYVTTVNGIVTSAGIVIIEEFPIGGIASQQQSTPNPHKH